MIGWHIPAAIVVAVAGLVLGFAFAQRRADFRPANLSNERTDRVWHAATLFALVVGVNSAIQQLPAILSALPAVLLGVLFDGAIMLVLVIVIDLATVGPLGASRDRRWLFAAPAMFAVAYLSLVMAPWSYWALGSLTPLATLDALVTAAQAAASGFVWWAYLPLRNEREVARLFE